MEQLHKFATWLERLQNYYNVNWATFCSKTCYKDRMCAVPCTEWGVEFPRHFLFCCDMDIYGPQINKCRLINHLNAELNPIRHLLTLLAHQIFHVSRIRVKDTYTNRGRYAHISCDTAKSWPAVNGLLFAAAVFLTASIRLNNNVGAIQLNITCLPCNWQYIDMNLFQLMSRARINIKSILTCFNSHSRQQDIHMKVVFSYRYMHLT